MSINVAMIGTFPPTQCGIATFTHSLVTAMRRHGTGVSVIEVGSNIAQSVISDPVVLRHRARNGHVATWQTINAHDAVIVQHEFGIFDGSDGQDIVDILSNVHIPIIVVAHTVLKAPTSHQRKIMQAILDTAHAVVTMTFTGRRNLLRHYAVAQEKVRVIAHGSADLRVTQHGLRQGQRPIVLTWGLLSEGKGIEWGIDALAQLADLSPRPKYVIAGQTHPKVREIQGEHYRVSLTHRAMIGKVSADVEFIDAYLDAPSLSQIINSADVVLLPYDSKEQVTSGVLVEAIVAGKPVISTRFPHAMELLGDGTGILVEQANPTAIAGAIRAILCNNGLRQDLQQRAARKGAMFLWPAIADDYVTLAQELIARKSRRATQHQLAGVDTTLITLAPTGS